MHSQGKRKDERGEDKWGSHVIILQNSSKLRTPSPSPSKARIMAVHSSWDAVSPRRRRARRSPFGVMNPPPFSATNISKTALRSPSTSPPPPTSRTKSTKSMRPSPSESNSPTNFSTSLTATSSPTDARNDSSSSPEIFPSPLASKRRNASENPQLPPPPTAAVMPYTGEPTVGGVLRWRRRGRLSLESHLRGLGKEVAAPPAAMLVAGGDIYRWDCRRWAPPPKMEEDKGEMAILYGDGGWEATQSQRSMEATPVSPWRWICFFEP